MKTTRPDLASRRARIARINAKRPAMQVHAHYVPPSPSRYEQLVDLLVDLLEARRHSGQG
jgi:hypothetical protein